MRNELWFFCTVSILLVHTQGEAVDALLPDAGLTRKVQVRFTEVISVTSRCGMLICRVRLKYDGTR
jgi:hypothetical protein